MVEHEHGEPEVAAVDSIIAEPPAPAEGAGADAGDKADEAGPAEDPAEVAAPQSDAEAHPADGGDTSTADLQVPEPLAGSNDPVGSVDHDATEPVSEAASPQDLPVADDAPGEQPPLEQADEHHSDPEQVPVTDPQSAVGADAGSTGEDSPTDDAPVEASAVADSPGPARRRRSASRPAGPPVAPAFSASPEVPGEAGAPAQSDAQDSSGTGSAGAGSSWGGPRWQATDVPDAASEPESGADSQWVAGAGEQSDGDGADAAAPATEPASRGTGRSRRATRPTITVSFSSPEAVVAVDPVPTHDTPTLALFRPPEPPRRTRTRGAAELAPSERDLPEPVGDEVAEPADVEEFETLEAGDDDTPRRRRRRGGRRRRRGAGDADSSAEDGADAEAEDALDDDGEQGADQDFSEEAAEEAEDEPGDEGGSGRSRRRRRRRRAGISEEMEDLSADDPPNTVVKVRTRAKPVDDVVGLRGSTRIEAKKQRRRDGREAGRRRAPILTEAEFLARREAVNRVMAVRQHGDRTQIAVLEDGVLVEHYVNRADATSLVGNVYLGKVQNVLPSMEAAFVDIGRGRNAVLYAGEVNWDAAGMEGQPKRIELALKSGDAVLVQATKDPVGHKGSRLTSQISLPGRFLVYVPEGSMTGISRKLPDTERARLKGILKDVVPEGAGVIVRTAAEGATEEQLTDDVRRLKAQWEDITRKAKSATAPALLYGEPDLAIKVVRDIFNEDFTELVVQGQDTWETLNEYIGWVAPDLQPRLSKWNEPTELYAAHRIDEQLAKALDRKVWLPSGGSLVIDRTEAMTVVDVNTGKFTGQGGNLEETVTRNNLEAAEEIVRQLRLRDIGGIIVVDFIDMVLESNRDLVLRRLVECLGRDRTKHQVAEVTSLGLVQMTRKRIGQGLLEVFSVPCEHCNGRGHIVHTEPVGLDEQADSGRRREDGGNGRRSPRGGRTRGNLGGKQTGKTPPPPKIDAQGHIYHDENGHDGDDHEAPDGEVAADSLGQDAPAAQPTGGDSHDNPEVPADQAEADPGYAGEPAAD